MNKYTPKTELIPIGNIAKSFGISDNTIRRMEAAGLLTPAEIKESGYRYYDADNIFRIKTILTLRNFGLVYDDMREFFNSSGDFTLVYDKLYEKKLAIDNLLNQARLHIKPENPDEIFVIPHNDIPVFAVKFKLASINKIECFDDIASKSIHAAVAGKYPVEFSRPLTIETDCKDFTKFDPSSPLEVRVLVPLRNKVDAPGATFLPPRKVLSIAYYHGLSLNDIFIRIKNYMAEHGLRQCDNLAGTFEFGKHVANDVDKENFLLHIMIPVEKI